MILTVLSLLITSELASGLRVAVYRLDGRERRSIDSKTKLDHHLTVVVENLDGSPLWLLEVEEASKEFVASRFIMRHFDASDREITTKEYPACHYHGRIQNSVESHVIVSMCGGGINGIIHDGKNTFNIQPDDGERGTSHLLLESGSIENEPTAFCGVPHSSHKVSRSFRSIRAARHNAKTKRSALYPYTVELVFVADSALYNKVNKNETELAIILMRFASIMSAIYKRSERGVRIALVGIEVWSNRDRISVESDFVATLDNFVIYNGDTLQKDARYMSDNAQLLTGIDFDGTTKGYAGVKTICFGRRSSAVVEVFSTVGGDVAGIMAHEMGHNFGMPHDEDIPDCVCSDSEGCVMAAVLSGKERNFTFSECSRDTLEETLNEGQGACLTNDPEDIFGPPVCGNGFIESGESCDCGTAQECAAANDQCCDSRTCLLREGAVCSDADDGCCKNCQFVSAGTLCRRAQGECDLAEVCSGQTAKCPANIYKQDGTNCTGIGNEDSLCYLGVCKSRTEQCRVFWGSDSTSGFEACYRINLDGKFYGHCGGNEADGYIPCQTADYECGKLQCFTSNEQPVVSSAWRSAKFPIGAQSCRSISISVDDDERDPGLVEDGTKCGNGKICLLNKCVNVPPPPVCPKNAAGLVCSGNGDCASSGGCVCSSGYTSADCSTQSGGGGGGGNSGGGGSNSGVIAGVVVSLLVLLVIVFLIAFCYPELFFRPCPALRPSCFKGRSSKFEISKSNGSSATESGKPASSKRQPRLEPPKGRPPPPPPAAKPPAPASKPPARPPVPKKPVMA